MFQGGMYGIFGLQNQWCISSNCCNLRIETKHPKYKQCHKVNISMRYLSRVLALIPALLFTVSLISVFPKGGEGRD